jgi:hypothetical protein
MKYYYLKNLCAFATSTSQEPPTAPNPIPKFPNKPAYRAWCANNKTEHVFYNMVEGDNPSARVTADNPPNKIHGFVADYDAPLDWDRIDETLKERLGGSPMPTWRTKTQSNYVRLIWEFEKPLPIAPQMAAAFYRRLSHALSASILFVRFDECSLDPSQYFELAEDWTRIGDPLPETFTHPVLFKASSDVVLQSSDTNIPLEDVAAEVSKRFPNRWSGDFAVGARGPLFWIDDGIDREGCQVREDGMICYSDRAGKGFVTWREILGKKFVEQYEDKKLGSLVDQFWFNGSKYFKIIYGWPMLIPKEQVVLELRRLGFSPKLKKGQALSEVEQAMLYICNDCRVDEIAPVVFSGERLVEFNGSRILNNCRAVPVKPADNGDPRNWPWIHKFLIPFFAKDDEGRETLPYFLAWFRRLYLASLHHRLDQGQLLILLGPTGRGKTLLTNQIVGGAVGGFADASKFLTGETGFNFSLGGAAAWVVDDAVSAATYADQRKFVELTKRCVANPRLEYEPKHYNAIPLPWAGRVMMSLNIDPNSLAALPTLDTSNRDKVIALRVSEAFQMEFGTNVENQSTIREELPFFLKWLCDWQAPDYVLGTSRFGVATYVDSFVEAAAYDNSSRSAIAEMIEFFSQKVREHTSKTVWRGTLTQFQVTLHDCNGGRSVGNSVNLEFIRRGMTVIEEVCQHNKHIRPVKSFGRGGGKIWEIDLSPDYDIDQEFSGSEETAAA